MSQTRNNNTFYPEPLEGVDVEQTLRNYYLAVENYNAEVPRINEAIKLYNEDKDYQVKPSSVKTIRPEALSIFSLLEVYKEIQERNGIIELLNENYGTSFKKEPLQPIRFHTVMIFMDIIYGDTPEKRPYCRKTFQRHKLRLERAGILEFNDISGEIEISPDILVLQN